MTESPKLFWEKRDGVSLRERESVPSSGTSMVILDRGPRTAASKRCPDARESWKLSACR